MSTKCMYCTVTAVLCHMLLLLCTCSLYIEWDIEKCPNGRLNVKAR